MLMVIIMTATTMMANPTLLGPALFLEPSANQTIVHYKSLEVRFHCHSRCRFVCRVIVVVAVVVVVFLDFFCFCLLLLLFFVFLFVCYFCFVVVVGLLVLNNCIVPLGFLLLEIHVVLSRKASCSTVALPNLWCMLGILEFPQSIEL